MRLSLLLAWALLPASLSAQSPEAPAPDTTMRGYYASLKLRSTEDLQSLVEDGDRVRRAFAALELHARVDNTPNRARALRLFSEAMKRDTANGWVFLGYGLALSRIDATSAWRTLRIEPGVVPMVAEGALRRALQVQPDIPEAKHALELMVAGPALTRDGVTRKEAESSAARKHLRDAVAYFAADDAAAGNAAYWRGTEGWDEVGASAYVYDVAMIATDEEMVSLTDGTLEKRAGSFHQFWKKRALRSGITIADRLAEHYRRMQYVRTHYRMARGYNEVGTNAYGKRRRGFESEVDDRGLIYMRFGEPDQKAVSLSAGKEAWAYWQPNRPPESYFFMRGRIMADGGALFGPGALVDFDRRYAFIGARSQSARLWGFMAKGLNEQQFWGSRAAGNIEDAQRLNDRITYENRVRLFDAFTRDAAKPRFDNRVAAFYDFASFRGKGCTDVVYGIAVPAAGYLATLAIADTFSWDAKVIDALPVESNGRGLSQSVGSICATPDYNAYMRFTVNVDSATGTTAGEELHIPEFAGPSLMMSDLLFAYDRPGTFQRRAVSLAVAPARMFRQLEPFKVYYEMYNLPRGRKYRTDITFTTIESNPLAKLFKGKSKTKVTFEGESNADDVVAELRTLVPEVEPGKVQVRVDITDLTTLETTSATKFIWIVAPDK